MTKRLLPLLALGLLAGCTVGPDYKRPVVAGTTEPWLAATAPGEVDPAWWTELHDPVLDGLVADAIAHNLDIAEADARLREARASSDAARGRALPQLNASGAVTEQQISTNGQFPVNRIPGFTPRYWLFDAGFDASWELDLWGGTARSVQAANARAQAAALRAADTRLRIVAEVVRSYVHLRNAQALAALLGQEADLRADIARLTDLRFKGGESSRSDAAAARQRADAARAQLPQTDASAHAAAFSLALLTGRPPEALASLATAAAPLPAPPEILAAGVRSELLQRRPDIRAAEADLIAAIGDVGVETANLYPRFSLVGNVGRQARNAGDLADSASTRFSIGPSFSWPIFSFGRIRAQIRAADARADAAAAVYEKSVLGALSDSETAANRFATALAASADRQKALASAATAADLADLRFRRGEDDRLQMLEARSAKLRADQAVLAARADALAAYVAFAKALGGGPILPTDASAAQASAR